jgi:hypothetical protein
MARWPFRTAGINASSPGAPALAPPRKEFAIANPPQTAPWGHRSATQWRSRYGTFIQAQIAYLVSVIVSAIDLRSARSGLGTHPS